MLLEREVEPQSRRTLEDLVNARGFINLEHLNRDLPPMREVHDGVEIARIGDRSLMAEIYVPDVPGPLPVYLHIHGGGFCYGSIANERKLAMRVAETGYVTISIDYALAPENPFPAAVRDCLLAVNWAMEHAADYGATPGPMAFGGQSAGATLAAATVSALLPGSEAAREGLDLPPIPEGVNPIALLLISGILSMPLMLEEPGSNVGPAELWHIAYLGSNFTGQNRHPFVSPLFAPNLAEFPATYLTCGCEDSMLRHTTEMTMALAMANVPTTTSIIEHADHAHVQLDHVLPSAALEMERMLGWMRSHATV